MAAVAQGRRVALANKECLVSAGEIFMEAVRERRHRAGAGRLGAFGRVPGDRGRRSRDAIERIVLTASGGPFRTWSLEQLGQAHARSRR